MEYEVKKGKKVGGRWGGMQGREMSPELGKWEVWVGVLDREGIGRAFFPIWKDLPPCPWTARHLGSKFLNLSPPALSDFCHLRNVQTNRQAPSRETGPDRFVWEIVPTSFPDVLGRSLLQLLRPGTDTQQTHSPAPYSPRQKDLSQGNSVLTLPILA